MKIAIVGTGYVGLVTGTCFSEMGVDVTCVDVMAEKIENLKKGVIPIYEPGLEDMVHKNYNAGRLKFTTDLSSVLDDVEVVFSAVGTPPDEDGSADLQLLLAGICLFAMTTLFSFITLPVEINASHRALVWLSKAGITNSYNHQAAEDALRSAAYTYVVAALSSLATLVYYIMIYMGRRE